MGRSQVLARNNQLCFGNSMTRRSLQKLGIFVSTALMPSDKKALIWRWDGAVQDYRGQGAAELSEMVRTHVSTHFECNAIQITEHSLDSQSPNNRHMYTYTTRGSSNQILWRENHSRGNFSSR